MHQNIQRFEISMYNKILKHIALGSSYLPHDVVNNRLWDIPFFGLEKILQVTSIAIIHKDIESV